MSMKKTPAFERIGESKYPVSKELKIECGYVTVPEARSDASGLISAERTLKIFVTKVKSLSKTPKPDPVFILYGGPGGNSGSFLSFLENVDYRDLFLSQRDMVFFDQRGTGYSEPDLFMPELEKNYQESVFKGLNFNEKNQRYVSCCLDSHEKFLQEGINLTAINTHEIVADMNDIRLALGYNEINLYSISYGTRAALVAMREYPETLRSVILDSVVPVEVNQYVSAPANAEYAFKRVFDEVQKQEQDKNAFPDLEAKFIEVFERLSKKPVELVIPNMDIDEYNTIYFSGDYFIGLLCHDFYRSEAIKRIPLHIQQAYEGNYDYFVEKMTAFFAPLNNTGPGESMGMYYSVNLSDDKVDLQTAVELEKQALEKPMYKSLQFTEFHLGKAIVDLSEKWSARKSGKSEYEPVISAVPSLILAGEFDQNTPSYWGKKVHGDLENSFFLEFPGAGHGLIREKESLQIMSEFVNNPFEEPDKTHIKIPSGSRFLNV